MLSGPKCLFSFPEVQADQGRKEKHTKFVCFCSSDHQNFILGGCGFDLRLCQALASRIQSQLGSLETQNTSCVTAEVLKETDYMVSAPSIRSGVPERANE